MIIDIPLPSGLLLGSFLDQSVSLDLNSAGVKLGGGEYHYSVRVTNAAGSTEGNEGGTFEAPDGVIEPLSTTTSPLSGAGQRVGPNSGDQPVTLGGSSSSSKGLGKTTTKLRALTSAQKLAKALKACEKKPKSKRPACEKQARRKYGTAASGAKKR